MADSIAAALTPDDFLKPATLLAGSGLTVLSIAHATDEASVSKFMLAAGTALLATMAFAGIGAIAGFIFAIPRHISVVPETPGATPSLRERSGGGDGPIQVLGYSDNSNLEKISDWLTTLIVGVALVQLDEIGGQLQGIAAYFASGSSEADANAFFMAIIVASFCTGFLLQYLWARLRLPSALEKSRLASTQVGLHRVGLFVRDESLDPDKQAQADTEALGRDIDLADPDRFTLRGSAEAAIEASRELPDPKNAPILRALARRLRTAGEFEMAVTAFDEAFRSAPSDPSALNSAGVTLAQYLGRYAEARVRYRHARKIDPSYTTPIYNTACSYAREGNVDAAIESLKLAMASSPGEFEAALRRDVALGGAFHAIRGHDEFPRLAD